jgi:hypothetical protein
MLLTRTAAFILFLSWSLSALAQQPTNERVRLIVPGTDSLQLDTLVVLPSSIRVDGLDRSAYRYNPISGYLVFSGVVTDSASVRFRALKMNRLQHCANKDSTIMRERADGTFQPFIFKEDLFPESTFEQGQLVKAGSISRGVTFGNSQDLAVNSNLNLQLSGKITDRFSVLASITDDNIPIQPDGNTQQLQDFDQVYIQLYDDNSRLTAGDFQITERQHHFLRYQKRARGATFNTTWGDSLQHFGAGASAAISKGKFARNIIQGVEGNQGPYRLTGAENERFIIIMAGTERVFIDGRMLQRGQEYDYTIDYNTAEITFTPKNLITKDRRIVVEFQYADRNYARALLQGEANGKQGKFTWFVHALSEQDSKNQPLQQDLDADDRLLLSNVGDDLQQAFNTSIDSIGFNDDQVLYALRDSLGYDSVLVFSTNPNQALYRAVFSFVGAGNGDYVEDGFAASGRIYRWVAPDTVSGQIIRNGDHTPQRLLVSPKLRQMLTGGGTMQLGPDHVLKFEAAYSTRDENTFSDADAGDDNGVAFFTDWSLKRPFKQGGDLKWGSRVFHEYTSQHFSDIERFRSVEFDRDWNFRGLTLTGDQHYAGTELNLSNTQTFKASAEASTFRSGSAFEGYRATGKIDLNDGDKFIDWIGSYTQSTGLRNTRFLRQKTDIAWPVGKKLRVGYRDDFEWNRFLRDDTLSTGAYRFHEWQGWVGGKKDKPFTWRAFYGQRTDRFPQDNELNLAAEAEFYGLEGQFTSQKRRMLRWNVSRRTLAIRDSSLTDSRPEETLLGRLEFNGDLFGGLMNTQIFYETGSGLEQARQFIYIEVPAGQGNYIWVDYNGDGVKDLNEFEIAAFAYEANYIRTFVPSDTYVSTSTNQFSATAQLQPARVWNKASGMKKFLARFSNVSSLRLDRKTTQDDGFERLNPLEGDLQDTTLLSLGSQLRNTLSFNRSDPKFGLEYTFQDIENKQLLANGFEARADAYHELRIRKGFKNTVTAIVVLRTGEKEVSSDFLTGRNYRIATLRAAPEVQWQPSTRFRLTLNGRYEQKDNADEFGGENAEVTDLGLSARYSDPGKGLFEATFNALNIAYDGTGNSTLSFEMLEGLAPGRNATWSLSVQRSISRSLQLNIIYNGRKSPEIPAIHAGTVQLRATF